jgi:hypothetical protein
MNAIRWRSASAASEESVVRMVLAVGLCRMMDEGDPEVTGSPNTKLVSRGVETGIGATGTGCCGVRVSVSE